MDLSLTDFQGWETVNLKMEGFTAVVGPSSRGKSALTRGLRAVLRNAISAGHIRIGTKEARVALSLPDHEIEVTRTTRNNTTYVVDGNEFAKLAGNVPPVMTDWGYQPVVVNDVTIDPIFAGQFDAQFLLSSSPAQTSAVLNAFSSTERLDTGRKQLKGEVDEVNGEAKVLGQQISALEPEVSALTTQAAQAEELRNQISRAMDRARLLNQAHRLLTSLREAQASAKQVHAVLEVVKQVQPAYADVVRVQETAVGSTRLLDAIQTLTVVTAQTAALQGVTPALSTAVSAWRGANTVTDARLRQSEIQRVKQRLATIEPIPTLLETAIGRYKALVRERALLNSDPAPVRAKAAAVVDVRAQVDQIAPKLRASIILLQMAITSLRVRMVTDQQAHLTGEIVALETSLAETLTEIDQFRESNQLVTCPKCHTEFSTKDKEPHVADH